MIYDYGAETPRHAVKNINLNGLDYPYAYDSNGNMTTGYDFVVTPDSGTSIRN